MTPPPPALIEYYQKAIDISPDKFGAFYNMGNAYGMKGNYDKAIEFFQKAIELGPVFLETENWIPVEEALKRISDKIVFILQHNKKLTKEKILHFEKLIEHGYGLPNVLKISYLMLQTYRRYVLEKDKRAIYELPKEQREFFLREIVKE